MNASHNEELTRLRDALTAERTGPSGQPPVVLSIAGSDPSGGAGVQADLKTATALGAYGAAAITSLTVQNTRGVTDVHVVPARFVADQCRAVLTDLTVAAIKIGMVASADVAAEISQVLSDHPEPAVVLDPVMVAASGDRLVTDQTVSVITGQLAKQATVITPNIPEAGELLRTTAPASEEDMITAAHALHELCPAVLLKGGHLPAGTDADDGAVCRDLLVSPAQAGNRNRAERWFGAPRVDTVNTHGTGCTLSTALAVGLAAGLGLPEAVGCAKEYLIGALRSAADQRIGHGSGPLDHLWLNR